MKNFSESSDEFDAFEFFATSGRFCLAVPNPEDCLEFFCAQAAKNLSLAECLLPLECFAFSKNRACENSRESLAIFRYVYPVLLFVNVVGNGLNVATFRPVFIDFSQIYIDKNSFLHSFFNQV